MADTETTHAYFLRPLSIGLMKKAQKGVVKYVLKSSYKFFYLWTNIRSKLCNADANYIALVA